MTADIEVREARPADLPALEGLYRASFPEEDLVPLVRRLHQETDGVLSLVAVRGDEVIGNVIFTRCSVTPGNATVALLGPLCAAPAVQKQGVGSRLVKAGLEQVERWQAVKALVLGDPGYYGRFGFVPGCAIAPPHALPEEWAAAWQFLDLDADKAPRSGTLEVPPPWRDKALWSE
ncbi:MAG: N-acetyltransferase [Roseibium sp.]